MRPIRSGFGAIAAGALMALALGANAMTARAAKTEGIFVSKAVDTRPLRHIAILPVVAVNDNPSAEHAVERGWLALCSETTVDWMTAEEVSGRLRKIRDGRHNLDETVQCEIWKNGTVTPETAERVARLLGVDAVLSLRIERWELADGGCGTVWMSATLTDGNGAQLWGRNGHAEHGSGLRSVEANFSFDPPSFWDRRLNAGPGNARIGIALYSLLALWSPDIPAPMFEKQWRQHYLAGEPDAPSGRR